MLALVLAWTVAQAVENLPVVKPGETIEGEIAEADPEIHTTTLDTRYTDAPVVGKTFVIEVEESGSYTIELRSYAFDAYLVLRDEQGVALAEDDDGLIGLHARISADLETGSVYLLDACALHGKRGPYELSLVPGRPRELAPAELQRARIENERRQVAFTEQHAGSESPELAAALTKLGNLLSASGDHPAARSCNERALAIRETVLGGQHPETIASLNNLAVQLGNLGEPAAALPLLERAVSACEAALSAEHQLTLNSLNNLAAVHWDLGQYAKALPLHERALAGRERAFGPEHPNVSESLNNMAVVFRELGDHEAARPLLERSLAIREKALGTEDPSTALALANLAELLMELGEYETARRLLERALGIWEKVSGPEHPSTAFGLNSLGVWHWERGDHEAARPLFERALAIREEALGPDHPDSALSLGNLGALLRRQGDAAAALPLLQRQRAVYEKVYGRDHPKTLGALHGLGCCSRSLGDFESAQDFFELVLEKRIDVLGPEHPDTAHSMLTLGAFFVDRRRMEAARPLLEGALTVFEKAYASSHVRTAEALSSLGRLFWYLGDLRSARLLLERALAITESVYGPSNRALMAELDYLGHVGLDDGQVDEAGGHFLRAFDIARGHLSANFLGLTEAQRFAPIATQRHHLNHLLSLSWKGGEDAAAALASKAQGRESLLLGRQLGGISEEAGKLRDRLLALRSRISDRAYARPSADGTPSAQLARLRDEAQRVELELARVWREAGFEFHGPGLEELRDALPASAVLLDFIAYWPWELAVVENGVVVQDAGWEEQRLTVFVYLPDRAIPERVDLGPMTDVEQAITDHLAALSGQRGISPPPGLDAGAGDPLERAGRGLHALLWKPLAAHVGDAALVFVAPDGALATLPFGALIDEEGRYLLESRRFVMLGAPGEVVRLARGSPPSGRQALALGWVDYGARDELPIERVTAAAVASRGSFTAHWPRLRATSRELDMVVDLFPGNDDDLRLLQGSAATEESLKRVLPGRRWIHLATHGFFQPVELPSMMEAVERPEEERDGLVLEDESERARPLPGLPPGLLSGLVCAGANLAPEEGRDNGLLTASEIAFLDLTACDLAFLSACETALGTPRGGEGLLSVQRAFHAAGARTVVSSLWRVGDESTAELVQRFYVNLWKQGSSKLDSLHEAQLAMLESARRAGDPSGAPASWAGFVLSGDWR